MKTYNSYEEAKIANPESEIVTTGPNWQYDIAIKGKFERLVEKGFDYHVLGDSAWVKCDPADYCMSLDEFFDSGKMFIADDIFIAASGEVITISDDTVRFANMRSGVESECFILHAAALNKPKRVKIEYAPINNGNELITYRNELFFKHDSGDYVWTENHTMRSVLNHMDNDNLFRRIETEIDWRDEFIEMYAWATQDDKQNINDIAGMLFDSGKFKLVEGE